MLIWEKQSGDRHYQLRSAGQSQRLYTNGVFHSQYRPQAILNGGVWDLLWLPLFFKPVDSIRRVLVLGLGSGAAVAKIHRFFPEARITAVEIDRWHIHTARQFTGLTSRRIQLVRADAGDWLQSYRGEQFDVIIDDLFGDEAGEPVRAIDLLADGRSWLRQLRRLTADHGLLVANCLGLREGRELVAGAEFNQGFSFRQKGFQNVVLGCANHPLGKKAYQQNLLETLGTQPGRGPLKPLSNMMVRRLR